MSQNAENLSSAMYILFCSCSKTDFEMGEEKKNYDSAILLLQRICSCGTVCGVGNSDNDLYSYEHIIQNNVKKETFWSVMKYFQ